jgi:hypothetical protein
MTTNITAVKGTAQAVITIDGPCTAADLAANPMAAAIFDFSDKVTVIRDGIELPPEAPLSDGDEVEVVNKAGDKGSFLVNLK